MDDPAGLATSGFDQLVGLDFYEASGDVVRARLEIRPDLHQPYGIVHGGVYCSVIESTASVGGALWFGSRSQGRGQTVGVGNHTTFLRSARAGVLEVEAKPLHRGRTQQVWFVTITDADGRGIAHGQVRLANISDPGVLGTA
ncbi:MAG: PaaI family thioesterase [Mycobacteriales bacterium]